MKKIDDGRTLGQKVIGKYPCKAVAVRDKYTGEVIGDYGEGRKWWFGKRHCCGSLCNTEVKYNPDDFLIENLENMSRFHMKSFLKLLNKI